MLRSAPYNMGMHASLPPAEASLPVLERLLIGMGVALLHALLAALLLRTAGHGAYGIGDRSQGEGTALSVTFVTLTPPTPSSRGGTVQVRQLDPENGLDERTTKSSAPAVQTRQVLSEAGERASMTNASKEPSASIGQAAADSTGSAAKDGSPADDRQASYHAALREAIRQKWASLTDRPFPSGCVLRLTMAVGGSVNATSANGCALSNEDRLQLEAVALMAQPLPYAGYEAVFVSELPLQL